MQKLKEIRSLGKYRLWLKYEDGNSGEVNLSEFAGKGVFQAWEQPGIFDQVYIDPESGAIAWNDQLDMCPDSVYFKLRGINPEDHFRQKNVA
ncbi:MAG: DUF2442 domain-containing protein [Sphingobacteriales bacterium]|nr:MAG: DUF2442 domain-containing protein [Sphingobacteriales bacterium]